MPDREKVIKGLTACRKTICESCPYNASGEENINPICFINEMISDALTLLKEQDAVEPIPPIDGSDLWRCGNCGQPMFKLVHQRYCSRCGRSVNW